jgi:hypothetical protein
LSHKKSHPKYIPAPAGREWPEEPHGVSYAKQTDGKKRTLNGGDSPKFLPERLMDAFILIIFG